MAGNEQMPATLSFRNTAWLSTSRAFQITPERLRCSLLKDHCAVDDLRLEEYIERQNPICSRERLAARFASLVFRAARLQYYSFITCHDRAATPLFENQSPKTMCRIKSMTSWASSATSKRQETVPSRAASTTARSIAVVGGR
jgi:hypothetical protein